MLILLLLTACEKWELERTNFPEVNSPRSETGVNPTEGILYGQINGLLGNNFVDNHGHVWSLSADPLPSIENNLGQSLFGKKSNEGFQTELIGLMPGSTYYYRAYLIFENQVIYERELKQFTSASFHPLLHIDSVLLVQEGSFTVKTLTTISNLPGEIPLQAFWHYMGRREYA